MYNLISGSCSIQATMIRMCFGLVFVCLAVVAHTAQSEEISFAPDMDILTIRTVSAGADRIFPYRFNANIALIRSTDAVPAVSVFSNTPRLYIVAEPKREITWPTNAQWQIASDSNRVLLSPTLRFESKGERFEIKPRRHSIWAGWRKEFP